MNLKSFLLGFISALIVLGVVALSFFIGKGEFEGKIKPTPTPQSINNPPITPIKDVGDNINSREQTVTAIESAIETGSYDELDRYLADEVNFRIEASGCCPPMSQDEAIDQLTYLNSAEGTWSFEQESEAILNLAATYPEYYSDAFIALSSDNYSASFKFNENGLINTISLSNDYITLLPL